MGAKKSLVRRFGAGGNFHPFRPLLHMQHSYQFCSCQNYSKCDIYTLCVPGKTHRAFHTFTPACCLYLDPWPVKYIECSFFHTGSGLLLVLGPIQVLVPTFSKLRLGEPGNEARYRIHSWSINTLYVPQLHCRASFRGGIWPPLPESHPPPPLGN